MESRDIGLDLKEELAESATIFLDVGADEREHVPRSPYFSFLCSCDLAQLLL